MSCPPSGNTASSQTCPKDWPVIELRQNTPETVTIQLVDNGGNNIEVPGTDPAPSVEGDPDPGNDPLIIVVNSGVLQDGGTAKIWMKRHPTDTQVVEVVGTYIGTGQFSFEFSGQNVSKPGMFLGTILVLDAEGDPTFSKNIYICIEWNATDGSGPRPLDIPQLRLAMRDTCPDANYLLDAVELSDRELAHCLQAPIDLWNESPPPVGTYHYGNFPFRYHHEKAAIAHALRLMSYHYERNNLEYSAAGVTVNDKNKAGPYRQMASELMQEFREWMLAKKREINIDGGYGVVGGRWTA